MAKKPVRKKKKKEAGRPRRRQNKGAAKKELTSEPWLSETTGYRAILILSLGLAIFMAWQLEPSEGLFRAGLWGLGFGAAIWAVFFLSLAFNRWIRGSHKNKRDEEATGG